VRTGTRPPSDLRPIGASSHSPRRSTSGLPDRLQPGQHLGGVEAEPRRCGRDVAGFRSRSPNGAGYSLRGGVGGTRASACDDEWKWPNVARHDERAFAPIAVQGTRDGLPADDRPGPEPGPRPARLIKAARSLSIGGYGALTEPWKTCPSAVPVPRSLHPPRAPPH
jgi:hypothetical protein